MGPKHGLTLDAPTQLLRKNGELVWGLWDYQGLVASIWYLVRLVTWMGWLWVKSLTWVLSGRVG